MNNKKAFSLIELIIVISIITLLGVVGMSYQGASNQKTKNARIEADIGTINNSLASYFEDKKTLPEPKGNKNYFMSGSEYAHGSGSAFGVHGFVTENLLPKKYLNYLPLDPRTNQYYAYGKTLDNKFYEVAGVFNEEGDYVSKIVGNYPADNGPYSLIREYNGPNFISNDSKTSFPYNPTERVLVGKINKFSGAVAIISNGQTISGNNILNHTLVQGDKITVPSGGSATIFFSDGSQSLLGDTSGETKLELKDMKFEGDDNLITKIKLFLESGTLWTKATNLNSENGDSAFEVSTNDTTAAVRGTIFGVNNISGNIKVQVVKGKVEITKPGTTPVEKTDGQNYNGNIGTIPTFPIDTIIPNNTKTGAVLENKNLISEIEKIEEEKKYLPKSEYGKLYLIDEFDDNNDSNFLNNLKNYFSNFSITRTDNSLSRTNSGFTITDGQLTANGSNNYLKYSGLDLGNNFTIEMSVIGLNRRDGNYTLFKIGNKRLFLDNGDIKFGDSSTIESNNDKATNGFDTISVFFSKTTDDNNKYNVTIKLNGEEMKSGNDIEISNIDSIIVGSFSSRGYEKQWNNIIDYIKIYTK